MQSDLKRIDIWDIKFNLLTKKEIVDAVQEMIMAGKKPIHLTGVNPETVVDARKYSLLKQAINDSDIVNIDNMLVLKSLRKLGYDVPERCATPDVFEMLLKSADEKHQTVYLLGAEENVVSKMAENIHRQYPNLGGLRFHNGFWKEDEEKSIIDEINSFAPDFLFIGLPSPMKETFILKYKNILDAKVYYGVGGAFDVRGEKVKRAPKWLCNIGFEGIFRVMQNPANYGRRIKKYYPTFLHLVRLSAQENPKVLVVATSEKSRGGITAVVKAYKTGSQWRRCHCHWVQTHRDGNNFRKIAYFLTAWADFLVRLPFYDIVHIHFSLEKSARRKIFFMRLAKALHKKTIIQLHCGNQIERIWNKDYEYSFNNADVCLFLSENLKKRVEAITGENDSYSVLYNPCPTVSRASCEKRDEILFSGTICQQKGSYDLICAFSKIVDKHPKWKLVIAGNGEIGKARELAESLNIMDKIDFPGWISGQVKDEVFRNASIFCLPSYAEGFPMAVLDAWAYGLPVITTPVGGIPDVAIDGENMLLFMPGDVNALATQMDRMIGDTVLRNKIATESFKFAETKFNITVLNEQLGRIYKNLSNK